MVYRAELLVEDLDPEGKTSLSNKIASEIGDVRVAVVESGVRWDLVLGVTSGDEAARVAEEIAVTKRRDLGLLLNPNYQTYKLLSVEEVEIDPS